MLNIIKPDTLRAQYQGGRLIATLAKDVGKSYGQWLRRLAGDPSAAVRGGVGFAADCMTISRDTLLRVAGQDVERGRPMDRRFGGEAWSKHVSFDVLRRAYEAYARAALRVIEETSGVDPEDRRKVRFYTAQFLDLIAPANYPLLNPEFYESVVASKGRNVLGGLKNLWHDIDFDHGRLNVSMSDLGAFEVGKNLAITPGQVVYQNDLMQLIQYSPSTDQVARRPLLIIPPWFNKFYVMDMQESNSLIRYIVGQGHTVFLISWRNPDENMPDKTFDQYMTEGPLEALEIIEAITGEKEVNALGYCLGGILLAITIAWLEARGRQPIKSGTYLTTLLDYGDVGDVKVFVNEDVIDRLERMGRKKGYLPGDNVAWGFRLLRAPDLLYSFVINHYLLGRPRVPFDLLYWNEDATNMPLSCHLFFMRNMYIGNRLRQPGGVTIADEPIDLAKVKVPAYILSTKDDHIAPWKTTYEATQLFSGPSRFVLGNSGHIAGVINPPTKEKYGFRYGEDTPADPEEWFEQATQRPGSWWPDWARWLGGFAGGQVAGRQPGSEDYPPLEPAPGSYVKQKSRPTAGRRKSNGDARKLNGGRRHGIARAATSAASATAAKPATTARDPAATGKKAAPKRKVAAKKSARSKAATAKARAGKKAASRKTAARKAAKKKAGAKKKVAAKKPTPMKKAAAQKAAAKKPASRKKAAAKRAAAKKPAPRKKAAAKKAAAKKPAPRKKAAAKKTATRKKAASSAARAGN
jgi:polyhydroxyalkanoate synthase